MLIIIIIIIIIIIAHADDSLVSKAKSGVCVWFCLSVCLPAR